MALGYENTGTGPNIIANAGNAMAADIRRVGEQIRKDIIDHKTDKQVAGLLSEAQTISPDSPTFQQDLVGVLAKYPMAASDPRAQVGLKMLGTAWQQTQDVRMMEKRFGLETDQWNERHPTPRMYGEEPGGLRKPMGGGLVGDGVSPGDMAAEPVGPNDMFRAGSGMMGGLGSNRGGPLGGVPFVPPETAAPSDDLLGGRPPQAAPAGSETLLSPKYQRALDTYRDEIKGQVEAKKGAADVARYRADLYKQQLAEEEKTGKADNELRPVPASGRLYNPKSGKVLDLPLPEKGMTEYQEKTLAIRDKEFDQKVKNATAVEKRTLFKDRISELNEQRDVFMAGYKENVDAANRAEGQEAKKPLLDVATKQFEKWQKVTDKILELQKQNEGKEISDKDKAALDWARKNPADPRAAQILEKAGGI